METKLLDFSVVGNNCVDCGLIFKGVENTNGALLCRMIYDALRKGETSMMVDDGMVTLAMDGISFKFAIPEERIKAIKSLIEQGNMCLELISEVNYVGFMLSKNF